MQAQQQGEWRNFLKELGRFVQKNHRLPKPSENPFLTKWVIYQRSHYENLSLEQVRSLYQTGFDFGGVFKKRWIQNFFEYEACQGKLTPQLNCWVTTQRAKKNNPRRVTPFRRRLLNSIGFVWVPYENSWMRHYHELVAFKKAHKLERIGRYLKLPKKLYDWVVIQRQHRAKLSKERKELLEKIGIEWNSLDEEWNRKFQELKAFKKSHGHTRVPQTSGPLGTWVHRQRSRNLTPERRQLLDGIGFSWNPMNSFWENKFTELVAFKKLNGHIRVPEKGDTKFLGQWLTNIKGGHIKLDQDRRRRLEQVGLKQGGASKWQTRDAGIHS